MRSLRSSTGLAAALITVGLTTTAAAQTPQPGVALNRFDPAMAGDRMYGVQSPYSAGHLTPHVMLLAEYAHDPLVLRTVGSDGDRTRVGAVVGGQLYLHVNASLSLWNRLTLNVDVPTALLQFGDDPAAGGFSFTSPDGPQFGDLRLGARVRLWGDYHDSFQLGLGGYVWVPTAPGDAFVGTGSVRGLPQAIIGGRTDRLVWSVALGPEIRESTPILGVTDGTMLKGGGGLGVLLGDKRQIQVGAELNGAMGLADVSGKTLNAELLFDGRIRFASFMEAGIGIGPGLTTGIGTPSFRGIAMLAFTPEQKKAEPPPPPPPDRDKDGILDADDACPDVKGVADPDPKKNGCPDRDKDGIIDMVDACPDNAGPASDDPKKNGCPDKDGDGIVDRDDACVDVKGVASDDPKKNGCPADRDGDGIADAEDACPDVKGVASKNPAFNGCPVDIDGDAIANDTDACPREKGAADKDPEKNGCPKAVRVTAGEILILQQVQFDTAKATIKKVSDPLLDEVAGVLKDHPEITRIEVQGHTDDRGVAKQNQKLSQDRAESVVKALVKRGVDEKRLTPKGYGQDQPIADNKTEAGRAKNRRVQFKITEKASEPQK